MLRFYIANGLPSYMDVTLLSGAALQVGLSMDNIRQLCGCGIPRFHRGDGMW